MKNSSAQFQIVFLIGMPGAGKTYWGQRIAAQHQWSFFDLDTYIELQEHTSIASIFSSQGEASFRSKEALHLSNIISTVSSNTIIACGGGTPCFHNNISIMKSTGLVMYLKVDIEALCRNIQNDHTVRPILIRQTHNLSAQLATLLANRSVFYEQAHHILHAQDITLANFDKILNYA